MGIASFEMEVRAADQNYDIIDTSNFHSTIVMPTPLSEEHEQPSSQKEDFTKQAALSLSRATQTNNIVGINSYYDIWFRTSTPGVIKTVELDFPEGTYIGVALLVEAVGIGPGHISRDNSDDTVTYTVTNPVNVPASSNVRIQLSNINNPSVPSDTLTATIITKDAAGNIIDGPSSTRVYNIIQIGHSHIADDSISSSKIIDGTISSNDLNPTLLISRFLRDDSRGTSFGWNPNGLETDFIIFDDAVVHPNAVLINVGDADSNSQCDALGSLSGFFTIRCSTPPPQGSELRYTIINQPPS